ncbi:enoyl-CoA hydratase/isomerase family protein [Streptomyces sp. NPDC127068]|uniref:enoyl-CoA hydratase/isomerase family protein n=1 Tax=Streptomyces sp. NPDC127068 TaxID=3347127 RepID=UPI0036692808
MTLTSWSGPTVVSQLKTLRTERTGSVLRVELDCPDTGNAITEAMLDDLLTVLGDPDPELRAIVLTGAGDDFCLGGDRDEYASSVQLDPTGCGVQRSAAKARRVLDVLADNAAVTIARVHGKVIGAGLALALACDLRAGADTTTFRLPELGLGMPIAWGGSLPRLLQEVGPARAREIILTARVFDAEEARQFGVLQKVVPREALDVAVSAWVKPVVRRPEAAVRITKALLTSYAAAGRLANPAALDAELLASVVVARHHAARGQTG